MADNELALSLGLDKAPKEVKEAAKANVDAWLRFKKASAQVERWTKEKHDAEVAYGKAQKEVRRVVDAWDPANAKGDDLVEAAEIDAKVKVK